MKTFVLNYWDEDMESFLHEIPHRKYMLNVIRNNEAVFSVIRQKGVSYVSGCRLVAK